MKIPFFKEIILSSFECEHCGEKNSEIQSGSSVQDKGCKISLKVTSKQVLQLIRYDTIQYNFICATNSQLLSCETNV